MTSPVQQQFSNKGTNHIRQQVVVAGTGDTDAEQKKLLEWELSSLGADDLRSHAWYHGHRVDRAEAERLLRQCVADEHGVFTVNFSSNIADGLVVSLEGEEDNVKYSDLDGLEDVSSVSSDSDFDIDDFLDGLVDERGLMPDSSTAMAAASILQQRRRLDGVLPSASARRSRRHNRRYFYCFLVRDSLNVRPPGRYVVSCLRVDKYNDIDNKKNKKSAIHNEDEQKRMQFLRCQHRRRQRRQQRHPVLHFVINEIILQPGTVYERSQFTFGDTLPMVALMTSTSAMTINKNGEFYGQRTYQPGFDSVPDLIRYYVGGADDNAVLSYGGGNDGVVSSCSMNTMLTQTSHTEVRIRYPCNRRCPLMSFHTLDETSSPPLISKTIDHSRIVRQHSHAQSSATALAEPLKLPAELIASAETTSPLSHSHHRRRSPSPPSLHTSYRKHILSSSFRSSLRRTPSENVTSETSFRPSSAAELATSGFPSSISLQSSSNSSPSLLRANSRALNSGSSIPPCSSTTMPRSTVSPFPALHASTFGSSSASSCLSNNALRPLTTRSFAKKPPTLQESISWEPSTLKHLKTSGTSLKTVGSPELFRTLSKSKTSVPKISDGACGSSSVIDVDAEIAAALSTEDNSYHISAFQLPELPIIQSSFDRVNLNNSWQSRKENCRIRPCINRSRSRSDQHRSESHQNRHENHFISARFSGNNKTPPGSDTKICDDRKQQSQFQQQEPLLLGHPLSMFGVEVTKRNQRKVMEHQESKGRQSTHFDASSFRTHESSFVSVGYSRKVESRLGNDGKAGDDELQQELQQQQKSSLTDPSLSSLSIISVKAIEEEKRLTMNTEERVLQNELNQTNTEKNVADLEKKLLAHKEQILDPGGELSVEKQSLEPMENEDFEQWRSRWANLLRQRLVSEREQHLQECKLHNERLQILKVEFEELHLRLLRENPERVKVNSEETSINSIMTLPHSIVPYMKPVSPTVRLPVANSEEKCTGNLDVASTEIMVENMVLRWLGIQQDVDTDNVNKNLDINLIQQQKRQFGRPNSVVPRHYRSHTHNDEPLPNPTTTNDPTIKSTKKSASAQEIESFGESSSIGCQLICDYENSLLKENVCLDSAGKIPCFKNIAPLANKQTSTKFKSSLEYSITAGIDYENITVGDADYQNVGVLSNSNYQEKRRKQMNYGRGSSAAVVNALRAVHLTIVGNPDDRGGITSAGTARLAAALCRADGRATILPYRRYQSKYSKGDENPVESILSTCPLQLLGQPGLAGRRARLDIIERFACLQYLVAMTVIVTPCLILIGGDNSRLENSAHECHEWSLEDEYEYRRRRFYYRCSGAAGSYTPGVGNDSISEDDDGYELSAGSDLDSGYSLPQREEWIAERRHWLDQLARHRATALDKWIRTAADVKQAVGDVFGYRALMSALCSDRIQGLQDAWASLRQLHTTTAVEFESRLRPEFLGRREKHTSAGDASRDFNTDDENNVDALLQLPPNATIPDPTALAVLYEYMYNSDDNNSCRTMIAPSANDNINNIIKEEKNYRPSSLFTSPLLLSPAPWFSFSSGISGGLGALSASDYGIHALHVLCVQYSEWVQQNVEIDEPAMSSARPLVLQLDRFRSNFQALLRQYIDDENNHDDDDYDYEDAYVYSYNQKVYREESNSDQDDGFAYEQNYENKVEEYGSGDKNYDNCEDDNNDDDDDDDATVICCSNSSSITTMSSVTATTDANTGTASIPRARVDSRPSKTVEDDYNCHRRTLEDDRYSHWIRNAEAYSQSTAPLNTIFRTELHIRLFWPPTLLLLSNCENDNAVDNQPVVPAYALGTTYAAKAAILHSSRRDERKYCSRDTRSSPTLNSLIITQLDRAAQDMRLRYNVMDKFLDGACAYSTFAVKAANAENTVIGNQQQYSNCKKSTH